MNQLAFELCKTSLLLYETFGALELAQTKSQHLKQELDRAFNEAAEAQRKFNRDIEEARNEAQRAKGELEVMRLLMMSFSIQKQDTAPEDEYQP